MESLPNLSLTGQIDYLTLSRFGSYKRLQDLVEVWHLPSVLCCSGAMNFALCLELCPIHVPTALREYLIGLTEEEVVLGSKTVFPQVVS